MTSNVIPLGAEQPVVLHALVRKRAELAGQVEEGRAELRRLLAAIEHIDSTIRLFNLDVDIDGIKPKRRPAPYAAGYGEVTKVVLDSLREADEPLTSRELAMRVTAERGLNADDEELLNTMAKRVRACLRAHRVQGRVRAVPLPDGPQGWELTR